ncbi:pyridoxal-phosphate dependent enzyme [Rhodobacteraceae bacterium NNCM2]|nr:pyridoxal-phosphate dependent enzyme [Coraliihabitans acroporae]
MILKNPFRGSGLPADAALEPGEVSTDPALPLSLIARCPKAAPTELRPAPGLARDWGIGTLFIKDESTRMGLGSFKALGAAYAIARDAEGEDLGTVTYVTASAGNHGLSVAAGASAFGARAVIYLSETVPEAFADRLRSIGAEVMREGAIYEDSMAAAARSADQNGWRLLSDSSWPGYAAPARAVMEGYLVMGVEAAEAIGTPPSHIFLQAGVGGMAAAMAAYARARWGDAPVIVVVEPDRAPALIDSIRAGRPVTASGGVSTMGRLDCKDPSHLALAALARDADFFMTVTDEEAEETTALMEAHGFPTTPSGAGGLAGLHHGDHGELGLDATSRVLCYLTEGRE